MSESDAGVGGGDCGESGSSVLTTTSEQETASLISLNSSQIDDEERVTPEKREDASAVNGCHSTSADMSDTVLDSLQDETSCLEHKMDDSSESEEMKTKTAEKKMQTSECSDELNDQTSIAAPGYHSRTNRELKSILALCKEAHLDTNIATKRIRHDSLKSNSNTTSPITTNDIKIPLKCTNFPVTAENDLDLANKNPEISIFCAKNGKNSLVESSAEGAANKESTTSSSQGFGGYLDMLNKPDKDLFCWRCHHDSVQIACETCPRTYHLKCLKQTIVDMEHWPCPECVSILKAENTKTRSEAMKGMTLEHLCNLLKYAVKRMIQCAGSEPFVHPVDESQFPEYRKYIIQPMTLTTLEKNIKDNLYGSTTAFEADAKWILHNSIIFNSSFPDQSPLTTAAKTIMKICKQEMAEIENCSSCYLNANTKTNTWFVEVCPKPHLLVWAKLKGFPYWPAKLMSINSRKADVRFFGAHDKAWVSCKDCFIYSTKDPNSGKQKRNDIIECVRELELYVENLKTIYGEVCFAPFKTVLDPDNMDEQLKMFLPSYQFDPVDVKDKDHSSSEKVKNNENVTIEKSDDDNSNISSKTEDKPKEHINCKVESKEQHQQNGENTAEVVKIGNEVTMTRIESKKERNDEVVEKKERISITDQLIKKLQQEESAVNDDKLADNNQMAIDDEINNYSPKNDEIVLRNSDERKELNDKNGNFEEQSKVTTIGNVTVDSDESSQDGRDISIKPISLDPTNICNIIHSSLVTTQLQNRGKKRKRNDEENERVEEKPNKQEDDNSKSNQNSNLHPIENILKRKNEFMNMLEIENNKESEPKKKTENNNTKQEEVVKIKDEIESEEEQEAQMEVDPCENQRYMEEKRKYLSALNISEKQKSTVKPKQHEIRTRSKTEEKKNKTENKSSSKNNDRLVSFILQNKNGEDVSTKKLLPMPSYIKKKISKSAAKSTTTIATITTTTSPAVTATITPRTDDVTIFSTSGTISSPSLMILPKLQYSKNVPPLRTITSPPMLTILPRQTENGNNKKSKKEQDGSVTQSGLININNTNDNNVSEAMAVIDVYNPLLNLDTELGQLKELLPENVVKRVNDIVCQQTPPKLKPKPGSLLLKSCVSGQSSSAGPISSQINSMAKKLSDYCCELVTETINDLGKSNDPEATITTLKLTIEEMNHRHAIELAEIRRNVSIVLKDIQKSVVEERERVINEIKSNYEIEMNRRVEEAKSKQWCVNCNKEAQFYCCWNTSYCDYSCQQKHWLKHMSKCTQTPNQQSATNTSSGTKNQGQQQLLLAQTSPKIGKLFAKPQKVYLKRASVGQFKSGGNIIESGGGNYEFLGNSPITLNGKLLTSTPVLKKMENGNLLVTSITTSSSSSSSSSTSSVGAIKVKSKSTASLSDNEH